MYHQEKDYVFHEDYMTFSSKDVEPMNIPYDRFTTLCKTRHALLFLFGKKLVLWLPLKLMSTDQLESSCAGSGTTAWKSGIFPEAESRSGPFRKGLKFAVSAPFLLSAGSKRVGCLHVTLQWRTGSGGSPRHV